MGRSVDFYVLNAEVQPFSLHLESLSRTSVKTVVDDLIMGDNQSVTKCNSLIDFSCNFTKRQLITATPFIELMSGIAIFPEEFASKLFTFTYKGICSFDFIDWLDIADVKQLDFLAYGLPELKNEIVKYSEVSGRDIDVLIIIMIYDN